MTGQGVRAHAACQPAPSAFAYAARNRSANARKKLGAPRTLGPGHP
jgi:hypothetical protein